mgnify:CR=1 FL=1
MGEPLPVHDCMGVGLRIDGQPWGVLTLDALQTGTFDAAARTALQQCRALVETVLRISRLEQENRALAAHHDGGPQGGRAVPATPGHLEIVGQSDVLTRLLHEMQVVAGSDLPVLLLGETGVGKELFARLLHRHSPRRHKPLVHVNCAALPESLAESELFGHRRGAFSGAVSDRPGRFEAADGGTLFLDEVGELPLTVQAKLLRTLQNGEIQRLGADEPRRVNVRVIAATNRSLRDLVANGSFRADLYHRLSVYPVPIPPLRERGVLVVASGNISEKLSLRYGVGGNGRANDGLVGFTLVAARATFMTALKLSFVATIVRNLLSRYEILLSRDVILFRRYTILITKRTLLRTTGVRYEKRDETMRFNGIKRRHR